MAVAGQIVPAKLVAHDEQDVADRTHRYPLRSPEPRPAPECGPSIRQWLVGAQLQLPIVPLCGTIGA